MKGYIQILLILVFACSSNKDEYPYPDQFGGEDLFSQLSQSERTMIGKWYFGYQSFDMQNETDSISYSSGTGFGNVQTDTIEMYSIKMVGLSWNCPFDNPTRTTLKLITSTSAQYFPWCFPSGVNGWLIEDDVLVFYKSFDNDDFRNYPIIELNNDSLVFLYRDWPEENFKGIDKEYAIFYKK